MIGLICTKRKPSIEHGIFGMLHFRLYQYIDYVFSVFSVFRTPYIKVCDWLPAISVLTGLLNFAFLTGTRSLALFNFLVQDVLLLQARLLSKKHQAIEIRYSSTIM
jgi:hypothetical protein